MKFILIAFALIGTAAAAQLPDSATQGPNPQDIATPEPEYIDIDEPAPAPAPAPRPVAPAPVHFPIQSRSSNIISAPRPIQRPIISAATQAFVSRSVPSQSYLAPQQFYQAPVQHLQQQQHYQLPGHSFSSQSGYQYRRPVQYVRRVVYRRHR